MHNGYTALPGQTQFIMHLTKGSAGSHAEPQSSLPNKTDRCWTKTCISCAAKVSGISHGFCTNATWLRHTTINSVKPVAICLVYLLCLEFRPYKCALSTRRLLSIKHRQSRLGESDGWFSESRTFLCCFPQIDSLSHCGNDGQMGICLQLYRPCLVNLR